MTKKKKKKDLFWLDGFNRWKLWEMLQSNRERGLQLAVSFGVLCVREANMDA
jgi:hypothetical protein